MASLLGLFLLHVLLQCLHKLLHVLLQCLVKLQPSLHLPERDYLYTTAGFTGGDLTAVHHTNFFLTCCRFLVQPAVLSWGNTRILFLLLGLHISGRGLLLGLVITLARPKGPSSYHHTLRDFLRPRRIPDPPIRPSSYCRTQCGVLSVSGYHARTQLP